MPGARSKRTGIFEKIFASMGEAILIIDPQGRIVHANPAAESLFRYGRNELIGVGLQDLVPQFVEADFPYFFENVHVNDESVVLDAVEYLNQSDDRKMLSFNFSPVAEDSGARHVVALIHDVTAQLDLHGAILESRNKFRAALDSTTAWVVFVDKSGSIVAANKAFAYHLGTPIEKLVGMQCDSLMRTPGCNGNCIADEVLRFGHTCQRDITVEIEPFQEPRILSVTASPYVNELGAVTGVVEIMVDVTKERQQQEEINSLKRLNEDIVQNAPVGIFAIDGRGRITTCNATWTHLVGVQSVASAIGANIEEFGVLQNAELVEPIITALRQGTTFRSENVQLLYEDRKQAIVNVVTIPLMSRTQEVQGLVGLVEDVTSKWEIEAQARRYSALLEFRVTERTAEANRAKRFLETVFNTVENGIFTVDARGIITSFNAGAERITGFTANEVIGAPCRQIWHDCQTNCMAPPDDCMAKHQQECRIGAKTGDMLTLLKSVSPLIDNAGRPAGLVESFVDITERENLRHELELSLEQARQVQVELEEMAKTKDDFIAFVSHELRTPLGAIKTFVELLLVYPDEDPKTKKEFLGIIRGEIDRLVRLVNDLLDFSQLKTGTTKMRIGRTDLTNVIGSAIKLFSAEAQEKDIRIEFDRPDTSCEMDLDPDRMEQVIANLLSNALKFTAAEGKITVTMQGPLGNNCRSERTKKSYRIKKSVLITVADTGIGLLPNQVETIFEGFSRNGRQLSGRSRGAGLGLPICKRIVELHGGRIWVESRTGEGTIFSIELPAGEPADLPLVSISS